MRGTVERLAAARARIRSARDAIAANEREIAAARAAAEARFAKLKAAQTQRRQELESLESREQALSNNLAAITSQMVTREGRSEPTSAPAPLTSGETAHFISENEASAPASAPPQYGRRSPRPTRSPTPPTSGGRPRLLRIVRV